MKDFVCALQEWNLFLPVLWKFCNQTCWPSRSDFLGIPSPFVGSPGWEAWRGVQNLHNRGRTSLVILCSSLWVTHLVGVGFDFVGIAPLLPSHCSIFFVFACEVSFLVHSSILLLAVIQQVVAALVFLQEELSPCPSTPPSWTRSWNSLLEFWTFTELSLASSYYEAGLYGCWRLREKRLGNIHSFWGVLSAVRSAAMKESECVVIWRWWGQVRSAAWEMCLG